MTDTQEYCCAAGVCCDLPKQTAALVDLLVTHAGLSAPDATATAAFLMRSFDFLPKAAGLSAVVKYVQAHPYR